MRTAAQESKGGRRDGQRQEYTRDGAAAQAGTERGQGMGWSRLTAAAVLIRAIPTVICPVTHPELGDAAMVVALKLHGVAELV